MNYVSELLARWSRGDREAFAELMPLVYGELRDLAEHYMSGERAGHTLQPTALVHEAYLRLAATNAGQFNNRVHFYGAAAQAMRRILVDTARKRQALKRGQSPVLVDIDSVPAGVDLREDLVALDDALERLAAVAPGAHPVLATIWLLLLLGSLVMISHAFHSLVAVLTRTRRVLGAFVRRYDLWPAVAVQIRQEHADERAAIARVARDQAVPARRSHRAAGVLEINEVRELARDDDVRKAVAVDVADRDVFGRTCLGPFREGHERPDGRVGAAEGDADVPFGRAVVDVVGLVHGNDVREAVAVEIGDDEAVAAAQRHAREELVVDAMLAPGDVPAVGRERRRRLSAQTPARSAGRHCDRRRRDSGRRRIAAGGQRQG